MLSKTILHITILVSIISACASDNDAQEHRNEIEIGEYVFEFPQDYKLIKEKGVDSYVGKISNGKIDFQFDYGYYSNSLNNSIQEYLVDDTWKWIALEQNDLLPSSDASEVADHTELIAYSTIDSIEYTLLYRHDADTIAFDLKVPDKIRNAHIEIDTIDNIMYKFVRSDDRVGLYAKNLKHFNESLNSHKALSIIAEKLSIDETKECYEILKSCKLSHY